MSENNLLHIIKHKGVRLVIIVIIFLAGALAGAVTQKRYGVGNLLRTMGVPYPTPVLPAEANLLPIAEIPEPYQGNLSIFILAGQSNMSGWAPLPDNNPFDERIFVFGNDYHWRVAREPVDSAYRQVDQVSADGEALFGPSVAFALASLSRHPDVIIGLVPCAKGSSTILQWQRDLSDQSLYGSCFKRALAASAMGKVSGLLFFQGETDALNPDIYPYPEPKPAEWAELFTQFIIDIRNDLGNPELPVVYAQLGGNSAPEAFSNWDLVKQQQASVRLPLAAMIKTGDLPLLDGLHFTTESYRTIGHRFANAYWDLVLPLP
jgi:hypothetical protein